MLFPQCSLVIVISTMFVRLEHSTPFLLHIKIKEVQIKICEIQVKMSEVQIKKTKLKLKLKKLNLK